MTDTPDLIDVRALIGAFAESDAILPQIVFALLSIYLDDGPFTFDASVLAERLTNVNAHVRVNAERLAAMQPELERFYESGADGWRPRAGVLAFDQNAVQGAAHIGLIPGEAASQQQAPR